MFLRKNRVTQYKLLLSIIKVENYVENSKHFLSEKESLHNFEYSIYSK